MRSLTEVAERIKESSDVGVQELNKRSTKSLPVPKHETVLHGKKRLGQGAYQLFVRF
jgi:hypothetical protein